MICFIIIYIFKYVIIIFIFSQFFKQDQWLNVQHGNRRMLIFGDRGSTFEA
jgi:hypothetical protein